ncbi:bifunctional GTP cyclohydrolase II/3, 4-dihydroxy-2butanone-4-phosphate synthase [Aspergillus oryzae 3.042]|uniref:Bifunctional GTP cyclohydrolase II/3, 4-dihydroxy-2butanone-4-phosphate synthase n=1 Tax=Aspergillus oryzae (strain 3.042) TaxID=1160506 RepID=I8A6V4_ASPO3|nr:bifunctional GTP cyclohydrolase II/3, 4-dihydroxy-2butanone-4-phosphate synthase [Aspergillus oryzae 3.042]|eukprot:EIT80419.1 bifunctional GTP cyclohydrolase II/3, 4-dihydroxy-2butanone-4-phosphate synthase [Aspergillus oryzae 3.042]
MGAHGGSYSIYNALAIAAGDLPPDFRPDFKNSEPTFNFPWQPAWADKDKIVSMDPYGHDIVNQFRDELNAGWDIRPTMAVTRANMKLAEIGEAVRDGQLDVDGSIVVDSSGEVRVTKVAVEPVWYLPGVADRFGVSEPILRRTLFEHTGGSYPELITRPDLKVFLPPIGGLTVYIFGPPERVSDENVKLALISTMSVMEVMSSSLISVHAGHIWRSVSGKRSAKPRTEAVELLSISERKVVLWARSSSTLCTTPASVVVTRQTSTLRGLRTSLV